MNSSLDLSPYKQQVSAIFDRRTNYDKGNFHPKLAHRLVEYAQLREGQNVLDVATGTGLVAIEAAQIVGSPGKVVGVDISSGMLELAQQKINALRLKNIDLQLGDIETIQLPENYFDTILCCAALIYMENIPTALHQCYRFLKPSGTIVLNGFSQTAFVTTQVLIKVVEKYGIELLSPNEPTGTEQKSYELLKNAGFVEIEIKTEQFGEYISLSQAKRWTWEDILQFPLNSPLLQLSDSQLSQLKDDYFSELEARVRDGKIWNDITTFWICGRKKISRFSMSSSTNKLSYSAKL
ncbi:methyltransferase domain-containing protein [Lusitaniella coriacea LEGE 07157]|uniref:Methyltransferase domain-containing protein n=1 Tax=Lusitaniella coriacea LEGE 07157 TaxID=945747 RepID=A0A8J7J6J7_9CYAN|nr:methyltransferase domain-containing protein [Lusitaniella coriacea]MBE9118744.1 methyltransferase domain-containing protein [Lusitaniella coriacea LEGE 07157]